MPIRATRTCTNETKAQNGKTLYIYNICSLSLCMSVFDNYHLYSMQQWWWWWRWNHFYRQKQTAPMHSHRIIYYGSHSISMGLFWNFAWRIYCHHWNLIVLAFVSVAFQLNKSLHLRRCRCLHIYIFASKEQTVTMLKFNMNSTTSVHSLNCKQFNLCILSIALINIE